MSEVWIWEYDDDDYYSSGPGLEENVGYTTKESAQRAAQTHCDETHARIWHDSDSQKLEWANGRAETLKVGYYTVSQLKIRE